MNPLNLIPAPYRVALIALAVALFLGAIYATGRSDGAASVQSEWDADKAQRLQATLAAELRARQIERDMTTKLQEAQNAATEREKTLKADAVAARAVAGGLRNTIDTLRGELSAASPEACRTTADTALAVFSECAVEVGRLAEAADGHASDAQLLGDGWPER